MLAHVRRRATLLLPITREAPADAHAASHKLLARSGFMHQVAAGLYALLPTGTRTVERMTALVGRRMEEDVGAQRMHLPVLMPSALWERSGRWEHIGDELFKVRDRRGAHFCLGPTYEEGMTSIVADVVRTASASLAMPIRAFQVTSKFRDEVRPRFGLMRGREFVMKDLYTYDASADAALQTYEAVRASYARLLADVHLPSVFVRADSGVMGGKHSHEVHVAADVGEDELFICAHGCGHGQNAEVAPDAVRDAHPCPECGGAGPMAVRRGIEVGHLFLLDDRYTRAFAMPEPVHMGCFGIGVTRILAAIVEHRAALVADAQAAGRLPRGTPDMVWPWAVAPYRVTVLVAVEVKKHKDELVRQGEELYHALERSLPGDVVLDDDARTSIGSKFKDADLVGYPVVVVVGKQWLRDGTVEVQLRHAGRVDDGAVERHNVPAADVAALIARTFPLTT